MTTGKIKVRIKKGMHHGTLHPDYDSKALTNPRGPRATAGDIIEVTPAEVEAFGDKFDILEDTPAK